MVYVVDLCEKVQVATRKSMQLVSREQCRGFRAMKWITGSVRVASFFGEGLLVVRCNADIGVRWVGDG